MNFLQGFPHIHAPRVELLQGTPVLCFLPARLPRHIRGRLALRLAPHACSADNNTPDNFCCPLAMQGCPDTYAVVTLYDPHRKPIPNIEYKSGGC